MNSSLSKILKIFLGVLLLISVVFILMFYMGGNEENSDVPTFTNLIIVWSYILLVISAAAAVLFPIYALAKRPKNAISALIGVIGLAIILGIAYAMSDDTLIKLSESYTGTDNNPSTLKIVDMGLFAMYFLLVLAIIGVIISSVAKALRR